mgnify:CR=1 FL=1
MTALQQLLGIELPIIQAPMAGVQAGAMAVAVSNAGGLGSLPAAMLSLDALRQELTLVRAQTDKPFNVNFFCHQPPPPDAPAEAAWRAALASFSPSTLWTSSTIKPIQTLPRIIGMPILETISMPSENDGAQKTTRIMVNVSQSIPARIPIFQR